MGTCTQTNNKVLHSEKTLQRLVMHFYNVSMHSHPDIDSLINTKLNSCKITQRGLSKALIEEIVLFLNSYKTRTPEQDELLNHFNYVYKQSLKKFDQFGTNLGKVILITSIEVLLCFKSLEMGDLTPVDVWWVQEHFQIRYRVLYEQYNVEYDHFLDMNYLIKFLYLLKECVRIELKKNSLGTNHFYLSIRQDYQDIQHTSRTQDTQKTQQKRLDTI
ncbi:unnamed protein product (macronuclear) [Paramecium tetraurelia]|uniref:Cyclin N-terminal domain-containing protein n=1 Tax=Paramecium tetraurelia TaxID=5888 RepID=A0C3Q5_PARTE|nr:uncharacterized protein GSPATT00034901001 [Paramecium tetraurelia]CAK65422.1 unnamed protein product [Paramecium tetraurelia]|eukprot:XP_001432819.1 hypothetical protein (macronuclear) [Paramecium tetraurelia strain d4-2]